MRGSPASPDRLALEGKAKEEFLNSARRGHEGNGGEGSVSERKGDTPEGWRFLPLDSAPIFLANCRGKVRVECAAYVIYCVFVSH